MKTQTQFRLICEIANEIAADWKSVNFAAKPYLMAMFHLSTVNDEFGSDSAKNIIRYFLCNASTWRGEKAREIKKELNKMVK